MRDTFHLFAYGTLKSGDATEQLLHGCQRVGTGVVHGTLYDLGDYPALLLSGQDPVPGEIWRCPSERLPELDGYEGTDSGLFRRAAVEVGEYPCWVYVAGPRIGHLLVPEARLQPREAP